MSSDPKEKVEKFLNENGYPFEMKVAKSFQRKGFDVHQSIYFIDVLTKIPREVDVIAKWSERVREYNFNIVFIIECKYANVPWILFSSITEGFPICYAQNERGVSWIFHISKQIYWENFFEININKGYGLTAATSKEDKSKDNAYNAIQKILSFLKAERIRPKFSLTNDFTIYVPIIAIDGKLFNTRLNEEDILVINEINEAQLVYRESLNGVIPKIHIVTKDHLDIYISHLVEDCKRLFIDPYMSIEITNPSLKNLD